MPDVDARPEADNDVADMFNVETSNATHHDDPVASSPAGEEGKAKRGSWTGPFLRLASG